MNSWGATSMLERLEMHESKVLQANFKQEIMNESKVLHAHFKQEIMHESKVVQEKPYHGSNPKYCQRITKASAEGAIEV